MTEETDPVQTPQEAILYCEFFARFGYGELRLHCLGIAKVLRELTRRLEEQAMSMERSEAKKGGAA
jgi:hypothetical protein